MRPIFRFALLFVALAAAIGIGAHAFAHGPGGGRRHLERRVDGALDAVKATPEQRASIHAAVEHVMATISETHKSRGAGFEEALTLFTADKLDAAAIATHRTEHEAAAKKI